MAGRVSARSHPTSQLALRSDWDLETGYLVWIVEKHNPRGNYLLVRIRKLNFGKNPSSPIRHTEIFDGDITRPTIKLAIVLASMRADGVAWQVREIEKASKLSETKTNF